MKDLSKLKTNKALFVLAGFSIAIAIIEGILYYSSDPSIFLRSLLIIENTIKAFGFSATISLEDAQEFINVNPGILNSMVGYCYMLAIFIAPYCTIATVYKLLEKLLNLRALFSRRNDAEKVLVFGWNKNSKNLIKSALEDGKKRNIILIDPRELSTEERYDLKKKKVTIYEIDVLNSSAKDAASIISKTLGVDSASFIFLMEESSMRNFSLLQMLTKDPAHEPKAKIFCSCDDEGVYRLIEAYYDSKVTVKEQGKDAPVTKILKHRSFDLEIVNVYELQVRDMFASKEGNIHRFYENSNVKPENWDVHMLIMGFGKLGQQALTQAMNLAVSSSQNRILIDVVEKDMEDKRDLYLSQFRPGAFENKGGNVFEASKGAFSESRDPWKPAVRTSKAWADGSLRLRFHRMNVLYAQFPELLSAMAQEDGRPFPYTYAVIAMDDPTASVYCLTELQRYMLDKDPTGAERMPVMLRMDSDKRMREFMGSNDLYQGLKGLRMIENASDITTFKALTDPDTDSYAKHCNLYYANMNFEYQGAAASDPEAAWKELTLYQRNSNRASAYHNGVKKAVIKASLGEDAMAVMDRLFSEEGLYHWDGKAWDYRINSDQEFLEKLHKDPFALEMLKMEHRRWCYYTMSCGWGQESAPKKNEILHTNPCIVDWEGLEAIRPDSCKYDLMPLMSIYEEQKKAR